MAQQNPPAIIIDPMKYLERLPEFSGHKRDLYNFINLVDRIHPLLRQYDEMSQLVFSDLIKSRIRGKARDTIEKNFHAQSRTDVKTILTNNFGEKFSIEELYDRMRSVNFKINAIEFYNDIKSRLRDLNNKTSMIMGANAGVGDIARNNMRGALNIFKEKIPEPMRTILACRNPDLEDAMEILEDAMEILFKSGYAYYGIKTDKTNNTANKIRTDGENVNTQNKNGQTYQNPNVYQRTNQYSQQNHYTEKI